MDNEHWPDAPTPEQIRIARKTARLTQEQAGALLYRSARAWQNWEYDINEMDPALWEFWNAQVLRLQCTDSSPSSTRLLMVEAALNSGSSLEGFFDGTGISTTLANALIVDFAKDLAEVGETDVTRVGAYMRGASRAAQIIGTRLIVDRVLGEMSLEMPEESADELAVELAAADEEELARRIRG